MEKIDLIEKSQKTLVMLKPNPENYTWHNIEYFYDRLKEYSEKVNCIILWEKIKNFSENEAKIHYKHLAFTPVFREIINYIISGECRLFYIKWENSIKKMLEFKNNIRKEFNCNPWIFDWIYNKKPIYNILHCSDSVSEAEKEVKRYFWNNF